MGHGAVRSEGGRERGGCTQPVVALRTGEDGQARRAPVVVAHRLCTAKGLSERLRGVDAHLEVLGRVGDVAQVLEHKARRFGLASARLAADHDGLILAL